MKLDRAIQRLLEKNTLDKFIDTLVDVVSWDKLMLAFSNRCVYRGSPHHKSNKKLYKEWLKKAKMFHDAMEEEKGRMNVAEIRQEQKQELNRDSYNGSTSV